MAAFFTAQRVPFAAPERSVLSAGELTHGARLVHEGDPARGQGQPPAYPPLAQNQSIEMESAINPIRMVLNGGHPPQTTANPRPYGMPPFAQVLSDEDIAAVVTHIRIARGNHGQPVTPEDVVALRSAPLFD